MLFATTQGFIENKEIEKLYLSSHLLKKSFIYTWLPSEAVFLRGLGNKNRLNTIQFNT